MLKKAMVVSHERSGTHFLMNTLGGNLDYDAERFVNFDFNQGLNFHAPAMLLQFFQRMHDKPVRHIIKSHHQAGFLQPCMDYLAGQFTVFYIYRDPRDVMPSFQRLINKFDWDEGPATKTVGEFMRAAPRGALLRYQKTQLPTMLHRWREHVDGWMTLAEDYPAAVIMIRYEELNLQFDATVARICKRLGVDIGQPVRPATDRRVVQAGEGTVGGHASLFAPEDYDYVREIAGATMERLNIPW